MYIYMMLDSIPIHNNLVKQQNNKLIRINEIHCAGQSQTLNDEN